MLTLSFVLTTLTWTSIGVVVWCFFAMSDLILTELRGIRDELSHARRLNYIKK